MMHNREIINNVIYKVIFENINVGMAIVDSSGQFIKVNQQLCNLLGYKQEELEHKTFQDITYSDDLDNSLKHIQEIQNGTIDSFCIEKRYINKFTKLVWVDLTVTAIRREDNQIAFYIAVLKNIDKLKKTQIELETQKNLIESILDQQPNMVLLLDKKQVLFMNKVVLEYFQCSTLDEFQERYSCICHTFIVKEHYFHAEKIKEDQYWIESLLELPKNEHIVMIQSLQDGITRSFNVAVEKVYNRYIINFTDISETMIEQLALEDKTIHDKLTQAYNREYFEQNIQKLIFKNKNLVFTIIDIDHFKDINDTYGHDIGDIILKDVVKVINHFSRQEDILIRWGGEEFILLLNIDDKPMLKKVLEHLREVIELHKFAVAGKVTCSFGAAFHNESNTWQQTFKLADKALYNAKASGRNTVIIN